MILAALVLLVVLVDPHSLGLLLNHKLVFLDLLYLLCIPKHLESLDYQVVLKIKTKTYMGTCFLKWYLRKDCGKIFYNSKQFTVHFHCSYCCKPFCFIAYILIAK